MSVSLDILSYNAEIYSPFQCGLPINVERFRNDTENLYHKGAYPNIEILYDVLKRSDDIVRQTGFQYSYPGTVLVITKPFGDGHIARDLARRILLIKAPELYPISVLESHTQFLSELDVSTAEEVQAVSFYRLVDRLTRKLIIIPGLTVEPVSA